MSLQTLLTDPTLDKEATKQVIAAVKDTSVSQLSFAEYVYAFTLDSLYLSGVASRMAAHVVSDANASLVGSFESQKRLRVFEDVLREDDAELYSTRIDSLLHQQHRDKQKRHSKYFALFASKLLWYSAVLNQSDSVYEQQRVVDTAKQAFSRAAQFYEQPFVELADHTPRVHDALRKKRAEYFALDVSS